MVAREDIKLRDYQLEDIAMIQRVKHVGLFNEQRTGKTVEVLKATQNLQGRVLILCPSCLQIIWKSEIQKWVPDDANKYDVYGYEKIRCNTKLVDELAKKKYIVIAIDEAHKIKNRSSLTFKAVNKLHAEYQVALTGTPSTNKPWDVWAILHWLYPTVYRGYWKFIEENFKCTDDYFQGKMPVDYLPGRKEALAMELNTFCTNRKYMDSMGFIEDTDIIDVKLVPNNQQITAIKHLKTEFEYDMLSTKTTIDTLQLVRQICNDPGITGLKGKSPKIEWLKAFLKEYPDKKVLIMTSSTKLIKKVLSNFVALTITGDTPEDTRKQVIEDFNNTDCNSLAINTTIGKEGFTFDKTDVLIFIDLYPPMSDYLQAKARITATVKENVKPKTIYRLRLVGTYDDELYTAVDSNCERADVINSFKKYLRR